MQQAYIAFGAWDWLRKERLRYLEILKQQEKLNEVKQGMKKTL